MSDSNVSCLDSRSRVGILQRLSKMSKRKRSDDTAPVEKKQKTTITDFFSKATSEDAKQKPKPKSEDHTFSLRPQPKLSKRERSDATVQKSHDTEDEDRKSSTARQIHAGSLYRMKSGWNVQFKEKGKLISSKYFSDSISANDRTKSKLAAEQWRQDESDRLQKTKTDVICDVPLLVRQWTSGFLDGDGTIRMKKRKNKNQSLYYHIVISFAQSCNSAIPSELLHIKRYYHGTINKVTPKNTQQRINYTLSISVVRHVIILLEHLALHCIIKKPQAEIALKYLKDAETATEETKKLAFDQLKTFKKLSNYQNIQPARDRVVDAYLAGLYCADGSIGLYKRNDARACRPQVSLAQKSNINLLEMVKERYAPRSQIDKKKGILLTKRVNDIRYLLQHMVTFMIGTKKIQATILLQFLDLEKVNGMYNEPQRLQIEKWEAELKHLKKL